MIDLDRLHVLSDAELETAYAAAIDRARGSLRMQDEHLARRSHEAFFIADEIKRRARGDRA